MRTFSLLFVILPLSAGEDPAVARSAALAAALQGEWRTAESFQREAVSNCRPCSPEDRAALRAELAGYLTMGGFPEASIPVWRQSLAELPPESPLRAASYLGLGVALHSAGHPLEAARAWAAACNAPLTDPLDRAACRFNNAVADIAKRPVWSEMEELLPNLLPTAGPFGRVTVLVQTAHAATTAGQLRRAAELLNQADAVFGPQLATSHPLRASVYAARADIAEREHNPRLAKSWRKKASSLATRKGWERTTVSLEELAGKRP